MKGDLGLGVCVHCRLNPATVVIGNPVLEMRLCELCHQANESTRLKAAPTLLHALGQPEARTRQVRLRTVTLEPYAYVACEHPDELLEVIQQALGPNSWLACEGGRLIQLRHVVEAKIMAAKETLAEYPGVLVRG